MYCPQVYLALFCQCGLIKETRSLKTWGKSIMENQSIPMGASIGPAALSKEEIKALRVELDSILVRVQRSGWIRPKDMVEVKLKESRHWLGECLKELGNELPAEFADKS